MFRKLEELPSGIVKSNPAENSGEVIDINFGGLTAPGMAAPVLDTDGANKSYVDTAVAGSGNVTANDPLSTANVMVGDGGNYCRVEPTITLNYIDGGTITAVEATGDPNIVKLYTPEASEAAHNDNIVVSNMSDPHYDETYVVAMVDGQGIFVFNTFTTTATGKWHQLASDVGLTAHSFNDVQLNATGLAHEYLNHAGQYSTPAGEGNVNADNPLSLNYLVVGTGSDGIKTTSILTDSSGTIIYGTDFYGVGFNDVQLNATGSANEYLNHAGQYSTPPNVNANNSLSIANVMVGASGTECRTDSGISTNYIGSHAITSIEADGATHLKIIPFTGGAIPTDIITLSNMTDPHYNGNYTVLNVDASGIIVTGTFTTTATGEWYKGTAQSNIEAYSFNDVTLDATGSDTTYLNGVGIYTTPPVGGSVDTSVTLTPNYMIVGAGTDHVKTAISIYADATGAKLYVSAINDVALTTGGSSDAYLNATGAYTVPSQGGNVHTAVVLTNQYMIVGAGTDSIKTAASIYTDATGAKLYASAINDVALTTGGVSEEYLNATGTYTVPPGAGNVATIFTLTQNYMLLGDGGKAIKTASGINTDVTGTKLYVSAINDVALTAAGSPTSYLNASGQYSVPSGSGTGNVSTSDILVNNHLVVGAGTTDVKSADDIYMNSTGNTLHASIIKPNLIIDEFGNTTQTVGTPTVLSGHLDSLMFEHNETISGIEALDLAFDHQSYKQLFILAKVGSARHVYRYSLPTAKYVKNIVQDQNQILSFNDALSIAFNNDGTAVFFTSLQGTNGRILGWNLVTPWSITTMVNPTSLDLAAISTNITAPSSFCFSSHGTKAYVLNWNTGIVVQMNAAAPFYLSGMVYDNEVNFGNYGIQFEGLSFKEDGRICYLTTNATVQQFILATPWDITSYSVSKSYPATGFQKVMNIGDAHRTYGLYNFGANAHIQQFYSELSATHAAIQTLRTGRRTFTSSTTTTALGVAMIYGCQATPSANVTLTIESNVVTLGSTSRPFRFTVTDETSVGTNHTITIASSYTIRARRTTITTGRCSLSFYTDGTHIYGDTPMNA